MDRLLGCTAGVKGPPRHLGFVRRMGHNTRAMSAPLYKLLPPTDDFNSDNLLGRFLEYVAGKGLTLYPAQEEAIIELFEDRSRHVVHRCRPFAGGGLVRSSVPYLRAGARCLPLTHGLPARVP
jgi:hypothetical protein